MTTMLGCLVILLATIPLSEPVTAAMFGLFKRYDVHLSPEVNGQVRINNEPVVNVEVQRILDYDKPYIEKTRTDSEGSFSFPEKNIRSQRPGRMLDETRIRQVIGLNYQGERYLLWYTTTDSIEPSKVLSDKLHSLNCDLKTPESRFEFPIYEAPDFDHVIFSICDLNHP